MILFCLEKKTGVPSSLFTTGYKLMFNRVLHRILVNHILVYRKQLNSNLSVFQYWKLLGRYDFVSFEEKKKPVFQQVYL
jgi:hypothetical protein